MMPPFHAQIVAVAPLRGADLRRVTGLLGLAIAVVLPSGCAHQKSDAVVDAQTMQRTIASLRAQNAAAVKQIEDLENQVFILNDRIDAKKAATVREDQPRLPSVRLHPGQGTPVSGEGEDIVVSSPDNPEVEYAGDAARTSTRRPVLRLVGNERPELADETRSERETREPPRPILMAGERMGDRTHEPRSMTTPTANGRALDLYRRSLDALQSGNHGDAAAGFREFLREHPGHDYADNAQYWLAECYYDLKDFTTAAREFRRVVDNYPQGNKLPDALLKLGFAYLALGQDDAGRATLSQLVRSYPKHEAAARAEARLAESNATTAEAGKAANP